MARKRDCDLVYDTDFHIRSTKSFFVPSLTPVSIDDPSSTASTEKSHFSMKKLSM